MQEGYSSLFVCVCLYVCYRSTRFAIHFYCPDTVLMANTWQNLGFQLKDFAKNVSFGGYGVVTFFVNSFYINK